MLSSYDFFTDNRFFRSKYKKRVRVSSVNQ